jgi:ornithine cyclodeaminase
VDAGFYLNFQINLPNSSGLMMLFDQRTGRPEAILLDQGYLTNIRTAVAGAIVAKYLAPKKISCIGILGAGIQARKQLEFLKNVVPCRQVMVWGINQQELVSYQKDMDSQGFDIKTTLDVGEVAGMCNLIVTVTPSQNPLLRKDQIRPGTHITAVGADTPTKNELEPGILQNADIVVADSLQQCLSRGEIFQAIKAGLLNPSGIPELGQVIVNKKLWRRDDSQVSVADLTGVAVQDIQIAKAVFEVLRNREPGVIR